MGGKQEMSEKKKKRIGTDVHIIAKLYHDLCRPIKIKRNEKGESYVVKTESYLEKRIRLGADEEEIKDMADNVESDLTNEAFYEQVVDSETKINSDKRNYEITGRVWFYRRMIEMKREVIKSLFEQRATAKGGLEGLKAGFMYDMYDMYIDELNLYIKKEEEMIKEYLRDIENWEEYIKDMDENDRLGDDGMSEHDYLWNQ